MSQPQPAASVAQRGCYCSPTPKPGLPAGFCGRCDVCGEPGHVRHHPSSPSTAAWCDRCFAKLSRHSPRRFIHILVAVVVLLIGARMCSQPAHTTPAPPFSSAR